MVTRRDFLKTSGAASAAALAGLPVAAAAGASAAAGDAKRTYVLVHGAWHGGWCWRRVADILSTGGHRVFTPTLTGLGDRAHLFTGDISLRTHVEDILALVEAEELQDFVLVGHSYAGLVISGAGDALRGRVSRYVYLDGAVPPDMSPGATVSWSGFNTPEVREARMKTIREKGKGTSLPAPPPAAFAVTAPADIAWLGRHLRPMPVKTYTGTLTFKNRGTDGMPRTYVANTSPEFPDLEATHRRVKEDGTWKYATVDAGHDSLITAPGAVASRLMEV